MQSDTDMGPFIAIVTFRVLMIVVDNIPSPCVHYHGTNNLKIIDCPFLSLPCILCKSAGLALHGKMRLRQPVLHRNAQRLGAGRINFTLSIQFGQQPGRGMEHPGRKHPADKGTVPLHVTSTGATMVVLCEVFFSLLLGVAGVCTVLS